jgi:hypothetical protein
MRIKKLYITLILGLSIVPLMGQYYETGQDPSSLKWESIKSEHFTFIFPETYRDQAKNVSLLYEDAYKIMAGTFREPIAKRFPIIIHSYSIESNGYVAWAPRRMELFPLPPQDNLPMDHHHQLALHELTHLIQMQSLKQGFSKPASWVLGEQYTGALAAMTPFWFLEGNAVVNESIYSLSGRGRSPLFERQLKALLLEGENRYSYDKMINGSYKDYIPNHYEFGYQMSAWASSALGEDVWSDALEYTSRKPFTLNPFNLSLRKGYDITKRGIYMATADHLYQQWKREEEEAGVVDTVTLNPDKRERFINYYSPVRVDGGSIVAIRTMLSRTPEIVNIDPLTGDERVLCATGYMWPANLSYSKGVITWAENRSDPRWDNRGYSVVRTMVISTGKKRTITSKTRYFSPSISNQGDKIVVSESTPEYHNSIVLLDVSSGQVISRIATPENVMAVRPVWSQDDSRIIFITNSDRGEGIMSYSINSGLFSSILTEGRDDLESVALKGDTLLFTSSYSGIDNIFALTPDGNIKQLSSVRFGVSDLSLSGDDLLFASYSSSGNNIGHISISRNFKDSALTKRRQPSPIMAIDSEQKLTTKTANQRENSVLVEPYRKALHLFNFHSWMPFWADIDNIAAGDLSVSPGAQLMSQNHLSTMISTFGYQYLEGDHLLHSEISYKGWYPAFDLSLTYGDAPAIIQGNSGSEPITINQGLKTSGTIYLPLHFNNGRFNQTVWPSVRLTYNNNYVYLQDEALYDYGQTLASSRIYLSNLHRMAARDIWPRWGQVVDINHTYSPTDQNLYGPVSTIKLSLYFPGLLPNHSIRVNAQTETKEFRELLINNRITLPRGYYNIIPERARVITADYAMPLLYPDFNLGSLLYLQRLRATLFYDYASADENYYFVEREMVHGNEIFNSYGIELLSDFYLLRIPFRLSAGVQAAWIPERNKPYFRLLFNMDVFGFVLGDRRPGSGIY